MRLLRLALLPSSFWYFLQEGNYKLILFQSYLFCFKPSSLRLDSGILNFNVCGWRIKMPNKLYYADKVSVILCSAPYRQEKKASSPVGRLWLVDDNGYNSDIQQCWAPGGVLIYHKADYIWLYGVSRTFCLLIVIHAMPHLRIWLLCDFCWFS